MSRQPKPRENGPPQYRSTTTTRNTRAPFSPHTAPPHVRARAPPSTSSLARHPRRSIARRASCCLCLSCTPSASAVLKPAARHSCAFMVHDLSTAPVASARCSKPRAYMSEADGQAAAAALAEEAEAAAACVRRLLSMTVGTTTAYESRGRCRRLAGSSELSSIKNRTVWVVEGERAARGRGLAAFLGTAGCMHLANFADDPKKAVHTTSARPTSRFADARSLSSFSPRARAPSEARALEKQPNADRHAMSCLGMGVGGYWCRLSRAALLVQNLSIRTSAESLNR